MYNLVSVIVPIYNVEAYLETCLKSLSSQTFKSFEVICVNDGSIDGSRSIALKYALDESERFKLFDKPNGGLSDARNYGLCQATGRYCVFVDADDYVHETYLEKLYESIKGNNSDIAVCDMSYEYPSISKFSSGGVFTLTDIQSWPSLMNINNSACNKMFDRALFDNIRFPNGMWYEDLATIPIVLMQAKKVSKVDEVLYYYVQRESSIIHSENIKVFDIFVALNMIREKIDTLNAATARNLISIYQTMVVRQGVELTLLRIKDFSSNRTHFLKLLNQKVQEIYPKWYHNPYVYQSGFKKFVVFSLFKLKLFSLLLSLFR